MRMKKISCFNNIVCSLGDWFVCQRWTNIETWYILYAFWYILYLLCLMLRRSIVHTGTLTMRCYTLNGAQYRVHRLRPTQTWMATSPCLPCVAFAVCVQGNIIIRGHSNPLARPERSSSYHGTVATKTKAAHQLFPHAEPQSLFRMLGTRLLVFYFYFHIERGFSHTITTHPPLNLLCLGDAHV